ncbi:MAG TPA: GAF domain-containing protein [Thermoanaerobaculia bacterium]|nr:GAF domain-containing protein [Thermoanaerobaculia bacterium]
MRKSPQPPGKKNDHSGEVAALLAAARAVLENRAFADAARAVLGACKTILGADAGLVVAADGKGFDVTLLDSGSLELSSATGLPAPLRRLSARASKGRTVFANDLSKSTAKRSPPGRRAIPESALLAPIIIAGDVAGLLGLINKPRGFSAGDCELAEVFAEMIAVAMLRYEAEQRAQTVADALREATVALTRSLDRETVLTTLLDRLRRMVPFDRASVMLVEEASRVSVRAVFDGDRVVPLTPEVRPEFDPTDHPIVHGILTTGAAVLIPDVRAHPEWSLPTDRSSEASWMGIPLFARGEVAGLVSLSKREPGYFNDEHVRLAEAMSSQASVAVENAVLFEQMQASTVRMQALSRRLVEVQESERRNIARELHDEAGQVLVSLRYGLRLLEREIDQGGSVTERVAELVQRTDAVIDSLHRLAADLRPVSLDHLGLEAALRQYSRSAGSELGLAVRFKSRGFTSARLPAVVETDLYRVVQEAMTNVVRHARATRVDVLVEHRGDRVMVMVEDDGVGFAPDQVQRGDHFGLLGIRERAEALGGTLAVESAPGAGTTVVVEVPSADPHPDR